MNEDASVVVLDLVREIISVASALDSNWEHAYYRFRRNDNEFGSNASYSTNAGVTLVGSIKNANFYKNMNAKGSELLDLLGKPAGVFLLVVNRKLEYEVKFEWIDLSRWEITKMDGASGIPKGI